MVKDLQVFHTIESELELDRMSHPFPVFIPWQALSFIFVLMNTHSNFHKTKVFNDVSVLFYMLTGGSAVTVLNQSGTCDPMDYMFTQLSAVAQLRFSYLVPCCCPKHSTVPSNG